MAIGTGLALLGSAVIGAGASILGNKSANKATTQAADTSAQVARENNQLFERIYGQNQAALAPYMTRGNQAGDAIMELLGFERPTAPAPATTGTPANNNAALGGFTPVGPSALTLAQRGRIPSNFGSGFGNAVLRQVLEYAGLPVGETPFGNPDPVLQPQPTTVPTGTVNTQVPGQTARSAFDRYRESTGYDFRFDEGMRSLGTGRAAWGLLDSGSTQKALLRYGQDYGSNEFGRYLGYLTNQQGVGLSGASALAGVGQNYANSVSANNQNNADIQANAALARGANNQQMYGSIANILGGTLGYLGSSYGR